MMITVTFIITIASIILVHVNGLTTNNVPLSTVYMQTHTVVTSINGSSGSRTSYSSSLNNSSPTYTRSGAYGTFYYEAIQVNVSTTGNYTFLSNSTSDTFGYLYADSINTNNLTANLLTYNDDSGGNFQFLMVYTLQAGQRYVVIFTTFGPGVTTPFLLLVYGPAMVTLSRLSLVLPVESFNTTSPTTTTMRTSTTTYTTSVTSNYASALNNMSPTFARSGGFGAFYYEAIQVNISTTGNYTFLSNSTISDTFGYLYADSINASDLTANLLTYNDDSGGNFQFLMTYTLQADQRYVVIFTTFGPGVTTPFSLLVYGPTRVSLQRINVILTSPTINMSLPTLLSTRIMPTTTTTSVGCNIANDRPTCPGVVVTTGRITIVEPTNRTLTSKFFTPNDTFFNLNDMTTVNGYVQSVTVQYEQSQLPTAMARIWIYGIAPVLGSFMGCSQYLIPSSQISTSRNIQTYTIPTNTINVFNGTYISVGVQDSSASIATTFNGFALRIGTANLSSTILAHKPLYFRPDDSQFGVKITYTIVT